MSWILALVLLCYIFAVVAKVHPHVAFVFAGSPRSFTDHFVHESIRNNLIHSFCPPRVCNAVLFFRISLSDNTHEDIRGHKVMDGDGFAVPANPKMMGPLMYGINRLSLIPQGLSNSYNSKSHSKQQSMNHMQSEPTHVPTVLSWADVGSQSEKYAIMQEFPSLRHRIFTLLDSRRYSMYYNRYKSFMQVPEYEKMHNIEFQWVVHVRLDAIWAEPVLPLFFWNSLDATVNHRYDKFPKRHLPSVSITENTNDVLVNASGSGGSGMKVWVVDTWFDDVPDTFALIPRVYADSFFDFDSLAADGVVCLGGGNVNITKAKSATELAKLNFSTSEINVIKSLICKEDEDGGSEVIMKNKLKHNKIALDRGNLGYQTFLTAMVRPNLDDMCFYLESARLIGWVWAQQYSNAAVFPACVAYLAMYRQHRDQIGLSLQPVGTKSILVDRDQPPPLLSSPLLTYGLLPSKPAFETFCRLNSISNEYTGPNCLLDRTLTDWNFMPFRLHKHGECVSFSSVNKQQQGSDVTGTVGMAPCVTHKTMGKDYNVTYSPLQLLHVLPLLRTAQQLQVVDAGDGRVMCLTTAPMAAISGSGFASTAKRLVIKRCFNDKAIHKWGHQSNSGGDRSNQDNPLSQMFLVKLIPEDHVAHSLSPLETRESRNDFIIGRSLHDSNPSVHPQSRLPATITMSVAQIERYSDMPLLSDWYHAPFSRQREASGQSASYPPDTLRCLAIYPHEHTFTTPASMKSATVTTTTETVVMETCDPHKSSQKIMSERTSSAAWIKYIRKRLEHQHYKAAGTGDRSTGAQ